MNGSHFPLLRVMHQDEAMMARIGGVRDAESTSAYLDAHIGHWQEHHFGFWMLFDRATGESIGLAGLRWFEYEETRHLELGYGFLPGWWGRGLGTEIAAACIDRARDLGFNDLVAITTADHRTSQHVLTKLGFVDAGTIMLNGAERAFWQRTEGGDLRTDQPLSSGGGDRVTIPVA